MNIRNLKILVSLACFSSAALAGMASHDTGGSTSVIPHPSAFECDRVNGQTLPIEDELGQSSACKLDGIVDSLSLWSWNNSEDSVYAARAFLVFFEAPKVVLSLMVEPAGEYCLKVGGQLQYKKVYAGAEKGVNYGFCTFEDGSSIEQYTLLRGVKDPRNERLVKVLRVPTY